LVKIIRRKILADSSYTDNSPLYPKFKVLY